MVAPGVKVKIKGTIVGNLTLGPGAIAEIDGKIRGDVINHGGSLRLNGKLYGSERHEPPETYAGPAPTQSGAVSNAAPSASHSNGKTTPLLATSEFWTYFSTVLGALSAR